MSKKPIITIWDIDKTLYNGYAIIDFGVFLEKEGKFSNGFSKEIGQIKVQYKQNKITYNEFAQGVYKTYGKYIYDKNFYEILQLSKKFWRYSVNNIYPASNQLHQLLTNQGSQHAAISGSSFESLYYLLDYLGFVKIKSTEYETIDGNFTSKIVSTLVSHYDKSKLEKKVLNQKSKYQITVAVGDNHADLAFLSLVDIPIVVGVGDEQLTNHAKENNWIQIEDPTKDLVMQNEILKKIQTLTAR